MNSRLCSYCSKIPFHTGEIELWWTGSWDLGTFGDMRTRNCPFCDLVSSQCRRPVSSWDTVMPPEDSEEIVVEANPHGFITRFMPPGCYICISGNEPHDKISCGREDLGEFIDMDQVRRWISACDQDHGGVGLCRPTLFNPAMLPRSGGQQLDFRLIDVDQMCLVYAPAECRYIALSYMWGSVERSRLVLTTSNEDALMRPGALVDALSEIPDTILDAINVVRQLHERYLWVDSLCLLQDDAEELQECVATMNLFYEVAILTIIAADGEDAWAGLRGVKPSPRQARPHIREIVPGLNMTTYTDMDILLRRSTYSTRAWTMQEEIISPRLLVFVDSQVYYHCQSSHYSEFLTFPKSPLRDIGYSRGSMYRMIFWSNAADLEGVSTMLLYYTRRSLSYERDVLRAAQGMLRKFSIMLGHQFFEGLLAPLDRSLLFHSSSDNHRPIHARREGFPSYSWTGWKSIPRYHDELEKGLRISNDKHAVGVSDGDAFDLRAWIIWHCKTQKGDCYRITDTGRLRNSLSPKLDDSKGNAARRFQEIPASANNVDLGGVRVDSYSLLFFWTICVNLRLEKEPLRTWQYDVIRYRPIDRNGEPCGDVYLDIVIDEIRECELALLAKSNRCFWALILAWKDGMAERRGVAELSLDIMHRCLPPGPQWKAIALG